MRAYLDIVDDILSKGEEKGDRTGTGTISLFGVSFRHDMSEGFPLLTTKKMASRSMLVELEGFMRGITDKKWYQDRKCMIWNEWCNPKKVPYGHDEETKKAMAEERDLGPVYGFQWRHFGAEYQSYDQGYAGEGEDQLVKVIKELKQKPESRRMLVSALNPVDLPKMALDPCHYAFQLNVRGNKLDLRWDQRSVDTMLGLPFNIASYGTLLHLLAREANLEEGDLIGHLGDTHIYLNHKEGAREQLKRNPCKLSQIVTQEFNGILNWNYTDTEFENYKPHPAMSRNKWFPIAV